MFPDIKLVASELAVGQTTRSVCPFCKASHEKSLCVTRDRTGILYNCFRAKCGAKGFIPTTSAILEASHKQKQFKPKKFLYPLRNFTDEELSEYFDKYEIPHALIRENGWRYDHTNGRVYMPILTQDGFVAGAVAKTLPNTAWPGPKAVTYWYNDVPMLHYPKEVAPKGRTVAVVEDIFSSVKMAQLVPCVALMGTSLTERAAAALVREYSHLLIVLDPGAEAQAVSIRNKYRLYFEDVRVLTLEKDPKDTITTELERAINGTIRTWRDAVHERGV